MISVIFMITVIEGVPNCTAVGIKIRLQRVKHKKHSSYPGCLGLAGVYASSNEDTQKPDKRLHQRGKNLTKLCFG